MMFLVADFSALGGCYFLIIQDDDTIQLLLQIIDQRPLLFVDLSHLLLLPTSDAFRATLGEEANFCG